MTAFLRCAEHDGDDLDDCYECLTERVVEAAVEWRQALPAGKYFGPVRDLIHAVDALLKERGER